MVSEHKVITTVLALLAILGLGVVINALRGENSPGVASGLRDRISA